MSAVSKENQEDENSAGPDPAKNPGGQTANDTRPDDGSSQKKKYGKFRALRSNQHQRLADEQSNDDQPPSSNCNRTEEQPAAPKTTERFIPPTLLNSEEAKDEKQGEANGEQTVEETADEKPKKGKNTRKKGGGQKAVKLNLDEIDDSNSPLRRRSSRLKVLEEKKESANSEPPNQKDEVKSSETDKRPEVTAVTADATEPTTATTEPPANDTSVQQSENAEQLDHRSDQTPKDKKKDKRKKDKKRSKKHEKRRSSRRKSSKDEESGDEEMDADVDKPNSNDCFTSPSSLATGPNASDGALKPEKVKSRWRRNSELETGSEPAKKDALTSSENLIHNNVNSSNNSSQVSPSASSVVATATATAAAAAANDENTEPMPEFEKITENIYRFEKKITKFTKEVKKMVCDCILTKEERARGMMGCGEDCLNRMLMIECGSKCPLENHCANKRFLRQQYSKVEAFKTAKKGWGLRALQPLQPNQFIMEYVGEVIGPDEFSTRVRRFAKEGRKHHFFMALKGDEIIDATYRGNITRFVNHSCDPNAETQKWTVNGDLRIGFFARKHIEQGEEITFNYQFQRYGREAQPCYCESENCRGFIGATDVSDEVDIELEEESESEADSVKKAKPAKATAMDKLKEEFEDLALEEEIDKLKSNGGLQNRQQTLMLARLMVRAEDKQSRFKLLEIIRQTKEPACIRLLLDYHALQLLWSWMVDQEDVYLKAEIISVLEILPVPNRTLLKDSKVLEVIEKWAAEKLAADVKVEGRRSIDSKPEEAKKLTNGDLEAAKPDSDDKKLDTPSVDDSTQADPKSSAHLKNYHIIKKEAKSAVDPTQPAKSAPNIALMAVRLLNLWKDLKEGYRIPRLERLKRHEDEKEADRKAMENEAEMNARLNNTASFLRRTTKRPPDGPPRQFGGNYQKAPHNSHHQSAGDQGSSANKIRKEEHRIGYNIDLMRKDYEEAMKQYRKQSEQYNLAIQQLSNLNGAIPMPIQPPMPPAPPNVGNLFPTNAGVQPLNQQPLSQPLGQPLSQPLGQPLGQPGSQPATVSQSPLSFPNSYNSSNLYSSDKPMNDFKTENTPVFNEHQQPQHYPPESDYVGQSNPVAAIASYPQQQQQELVTYNHLYTYDQQSIETGSTDVCMEQDESQQSTTSEPLEKSWNTIYSELTGGLQSNTIVCTGEEHTFSENDLQSDYQFVADTMGNVSELYGEIYPRPGTYLVSDGRTFFMPCYSDGCPPEQMVVECNFDLPNQELSKRPLPENWKSAKTPNGYYYYYNRITRQVQWSPPFDRTEMQNSTAANAKSDQNVVVSSAADSTSTPKFDTSSIDASKINLATLNEILKMSNGLASAGDSELDPRKRLKQEDDSQEPLNTGLSLELENKIIKFPTYQQLKAERRKSTKERQKEFKENKERFKAELSEHIKSLLKPYLRHDCKASRFLCDDDFKQVARRLTHEVFGKELKRATNKQETLQFSASVKQKSTDFVQKYMARQKGPFYKPPEERSGDEDEEEPHDDKRRRLLLSSPAHHHHYQTTSNSASNSLDTTPRVDTTPKVEHQIVSASPKAPLGDDASPGTVETATSDTPPEATSETTTLSAADLVASVTTNSVATTETTHESTVKCERGIDSEMQTEMVADSAIDSEVTGSHLDLNDQPITADEVRQGV